MKKLVIITIILLSSYFLNAQVLTPISEQIGKIARTFSLDSTQALEYASHLPALPSNAIGWVAIPKLTSLNSLAGGYNGVKQDSLLGKIAKIATEKLYQYVNVCCGMGVLLERTKLFESERLISFKQKIELEQPGDIFVVPINFELTNEKKCQPKQFDLGIVEVLGILISNINIFEYTKNEGYFGKQKYVACYPNSLMIRFGEFVESSDFEDLDSNMLPGNKIVYRITAIMP